MGKRMEKLALGLTMAALTIPFWGCGAPKKPSPCRNPKYAQVMKEQAVAYYQKGDYTNALKSLKEAEACKPKDADFYFWLGKIYMSRDRSYDALESFKKSIEIDDAFVESHMALGVVLLGLERWDEAVAEFEAATRNDMFQRPWEAYNNLGWAYLQKGDYALAEVNLRQAVRLNNRYCPAYSNLGELYSKQGDRDKAVENFQKAIAICPANYARPRFLIAIEYGHLGYYNRSCDELQAAALVKNAPEAEQILEYQRLYNCPGATPP